MWKVSSGVQVGNLTVDQNFWGRPEDITTPRPYYAVPLNRATFNSSAVDLGASIAAGLLAAYTAVPDAPNAALYLSTGGFGSCGIQLSSPRQAVQFYVPRQLHSNLPIPRQATFDGNFSSVKRAKRKSAITQPLPECCCPLGRTTYKSKAGGGQDAAQSTVTTIGPRIQVKHVSIEFDILFAGLGLYGALSTSLRSGNPYRIYTYAGSATRFCGVGTAPGIGSSCPGGAASLYPSVTFHDHALWASAWVYQATGNVSVIGQAQTFQQSFLQTEGNAGLL